MITIDIVILKELLKDYKDGKFSLDTLNIDSDNWVSTDNGWYVIVEEEED